MAVKKNDLRGQKEAHTKLGQTYHFTGQYKRAVEHYSKALEMARRTGDPRDRSRARHRLTGVMLTMADYRAAERYARESLKEVEKLGDAGASPQRTTIWDSWKRTGDASKRP